MLNRRPAPPSPPFPGPGPRAKGEGPDGADGCRDARPSHVKVEADLEDDLRLQQALLMQPALWVGGGDLGAALALAAAALSAQAAAVAALGGAAARDAAFEPWYDVARGRFRPMKVGLGAGACGPCGARPFLGGRAAPWPRRRRHAHMGARTKPRRAPRPRPAQKVRWAGDRCAVCDSDVDYDCDRLVSCDGCGVCAHQSCYGVHELPELDDMWLCRWALRGPRKGGRRHLTPKNEGRRPRKPPCRAVAPGPLFRRPRRFPEDGLEFTAAPLLAARPS
jgi:hypothetical protein